MAFTQYKTLSDVLKKYRIKYVEEKYIIDNFTKAPEYLKEDITFTLKEVAYDVSEYAICENLIYPVLKAAWKLYADKFAIWSHQGIQFDEELSGIPDYMISKRSDLGKIIFETPYIAVVEAKKDDFTGGWAQCALEMYTIQKINANEELPIFGIVSNGETWEIAKFEGKIFTMFNTRMDINELDTLFSTLVSILRLYEKYF